MSFKVLQFGKFYPPAVGGIEKAMFDITEGLNNRGIRCDVLCSNENRNRLEEDYGKYKVVRAPSLGRMFSTSIAPQLILELKKMINDYDIIHIHQPDPMATVALFLVNPKRQKVVVHWHSDIVKNVPFLRIYNALQSWLLNRSDKVIITTPKYLEGSFSLQSVSFKIRIIPRSIMFVDCSNSNLGSILPDGKKVIFSLGRLIGYKGFSYLIRSAMYLDDGYLILIGGDGPLKEDLKEEIEIYGLENRVKLLGKIDDSQLSYYYKACDLFCLPSIERSEAFGLVLLEAMSMRKPIVATNIPGSGTSWVNKHLFSGVNVIPKEPKAIALAIKTICGNSRLKDMFAYHSYKRFVDKFTTNIEIDSVISLYKEILGG